MFGGLIDGVGVNLEELERDINRPGTLLVVRIDVTLKW